MALIFGARRNPGVRRAASLTGRFNGESFLAYVDQVLVPILKPGGTVIIDNLGSRKGKTVRRAIRAALTSIRSNRSSPSSRPCYAKSNH
jgi:hypothetical protein